MNRGVVNSRRSLGLRRIRRIADLLAPVPVRIADELARDLLRRKAESLAQLNPAAGAEPALCTHCGQPAPLSSGAPDPATPRGDGQ